MIFGTTKFKCYNAIEYNNSLARPNINYPYW